MASIDEEVDRKFREIYQPLSCNFDPAVLGDPIATLTKWEPCGKSSAAFRTRKLVRCDSHRVELRCTFRAIRFLGFFAVATLALGVVLFQVAFSGPVDEIVPRILVGLLSLGFSGGFIWLILKELTPTVFDLNHGTFYKSRRKPEPATHPGGPKNGVTLDRIHALQIIERYKTPTSPKSGSSIVTKGYFVFELNLVLEDGSRTNVLSHGDKTSLFDDARSLSQFLGKPLWNATVQQAE